MKEINGKNNLDELKRDVSIVDMARRFGLTPVRVGSRYYSLKEHDSVRIDTQNNRYIRNSTAEHGSVIDFVMNFERVNLAEAIKIIKEANGIYPRERPKDIPKEEKSKKTLEIPKKDSHNRNVFAYLTKTRMLDAEIVNKAIKEGMLYQDTNKNCVFVSKDEAGKIRFINRRGTNPEKRFVQDMEGSDYTHSFFIDNKSKTLVLCESVIDAFSYMNIEKMKGREYTGKSYISLSGVYKYEEALKYHLNKNNYEKIIIALDNDNGGKTGTENIIKYIDENYPNLSKNIEVDIPNFKDFNDELKAIKEKGISSSIISEQAKGENMNKEENGDAKKKFSVREYIEKYPEKTLNLITPDGYVTIPSGYSGEDLYASNGAVDSTKIPVNSNEILNQVFSSMDINEYKRETYIITEYTEDIENEKVGEKLMNSIEQVSENITEKMNENKTFDIEITEVLQKNVSIEARNLSEAIDKAKEQYRKGEIVLTSEDYISTNIDPIKDTLDKDMEVEKRPEQEKQNKENKLYISLPKGLCKQMDSKLNEGEKFNTMIIPRGTELNGKDIGGCLFNPKYMIENKFNKNEMTAIYYTDKLQDGKINILHPDNLKEKVDLKELKESIDIRQKEFRKELKEKELQRQNEKDKNQDKSKDQGEEI